MVLGVPNSPECLDSLHKLKGVCTELNIPLAEEKQDGPTSVITLLGIIIDTIKGELRLPGDKLQRLLAAVHQWLGRKSCTRRELESLIGTLQHACKVIIPGRSFLKRAIALLSTTRSRHHHIRLNKEFKSDLAWWKYFATPWNGVSLIVNQASPERVVTSDASGSWGCGAWHEELWFQITWDERTDNWHIAAKELVPIIVAAVVWGDKWTGNRVIARCDNEAVVAVINSRYATDRTLMQMLRCLFFIEAHFQFSLSASHLPGVHNDLADDLSRNNVPSFLRKMPKVSPTPTVIPNSLLQWLLHPNLDWTSPSWTTLFNTSVRRV